MIFPDDLEQWRRAMAELHAAIVPDQDSRAAVKAAAALWSRCAANSAPPPVAELLLNAMEIGYAAAGRPPRQRLRRSAAGLAPHPGGTLSQPRRSLIILEGPQEPAAAASPMPASPARRPPPRRRSGSSA